MKYSSFLKSEFSPKTPGHQSAKSEFAVKA
jgi:hypothetical protein